MKNTSATVPIFVKKEVERLSDKSEMSVSNITIMMLDTIVPKISSKRVFGSLVKYQTRETGKKVKIDYIPADELIDDIHYIRWKYKISVSSLITLCYILYWKTICKKIINFFDSNMENLRSKGLKNLHCQLDCFKKMNYSLIEVLLE